MNTRELLLNFNRQGIYFKLVDDDLEIDFPEGKEIDEEIAIIKDNKKDLIQLLKSTSFPPLSLVKAEFKKFYPLSSAQKRVYFVQQVNPLGISYNMPLVMKLDSDVDIERLEDVFNALIDRHEILRTSFVIIDSEPVQYISAKSEFELDRIDCEESLLSSVIKNYIRPFNLAEDMLFRAALIHVDQRYYVLQVDMHHIVSDGITNVIIEEDFLALLRGEPLPELKYQYKDFSEWQNKLITNGLLIKQEQYWLDLHAGTVPRLEFLGDFKRPDIFTFRGETYTFKLTGPEVQGIKSMGTRYGGTLYMNILALLNTLFYKYTGQQDIIIGTGVAGRRHADLQRTAGMFVNTLAMRNKPSGNKKFDDFLKEVVINTITAFENQDAQFETIIERLNLKRDSSRNNPLFDINMVVQNFNASSPGKGIGSATSDLNKHAAAKVDLNFLVEELDNEILFTIEYYSDVFKRDTLRALEQHFKQLIKTVLKRPDILLSQIDILTPTERKELLKKNSHHSSIPSDVIELFEVQVRMRPNQVALISGSIAITYQDLNVRANKLANWLQRKGIKANSRIAVMLGRCPESIISILAIWKTRSAFLPIDPDYPNDRIQYIIDDARVEGVISFESLYNIRRLSVDCPLIFLESYWNQIEREPPVFSTVNENQNPLSYIIYTSGTSGKPKGVLVNQRALANLINWHISSFDVTYHSTATVIAGSAFDASVWETWPYLASGAKIVIVTDEERLSMNKLFNVIETNNVTHSFLPTALIPGFLKTAKTATNSLKFLFTGGDNLASVNQDKMNFSLINNYGPTEGTVVATSCPLNTEEDLTKPHIGKPIYNMDAYVVDNDLQLLPMGFVGELVIGGVQISEGYLNNPELTGEKFFANPFEEGKSKVYRTGDLARWRADGNIEFVGRLDEQVKIRGYRVELGELESVLNFANNVNQCAVICHKDETGNNCLVAYVTTFGDFNKQEILNFLRANLPAYMLPQHIINLERMPLTVNGKINKKELRFVDQSLTMATTIFQNEKNEEKLVRIWANALSVEAAEITKSSDFFDLGGHSLMAISVLASIKDEMRVEIGISDFFNEPNINGLLKQINQKVSIGLPPVTVSSPRPERIPLSFSQERLWFIDKFHGTVNYHMSTVVKVLGNVDRKAMTYAFKKIIYRHEILRTIYKEVNGEVFQQVLPKEDWQLQVVQNLNFDNGSFKKYIDEQIAEPFDLSKDLSIRVKLIPIATGEHILILVFHHIASDGWSNSLFVKEFMEFYQSRIENRPPDINDLELQYSDFAIWQRKYLIDDVLKNKLSYWKNKLTGAIPLRLPVDSSISSETVKLSKAIDFEIDTDLFNGIKLLAAKESTTLYMTLLAGFHVLLARYSGQDDICIGTPVANRLQKEIEPLMGFFLNTIVLRNDVSDNPSFLDFLSAVKSTTIEAFANQEVPFEKVVETVLPSRDPSKNPLFQVMFNLLNQPRKEVHLKGLTFEWLEAAATPSKFDLALYMSESAQGMIGTLDYDATLFSELKVQQMTIHFKKLLQEIVNHPLDGVKSLNFLSNEELDHLRIQSNDFFN